VTSWNVDNEESAVSKNSARAHDSGSRGVAGSARCVKRVQGVDHDRTCDQCRPRVQSFLMQSNITKQILHRTLILSSYNKIINIFCLIIVLVELFLIYSDTLVQESFSEIVLVVLLKRCFY